MVSLNKARTYEVEAQLKAQSLIKMLRVAFGNFHNFQSCKKPQRGDLRLRKKTLLLIRSLSVNISLRAVRTDDGLAF